MHRNAIVRAQQQRVSSHARSSDAYTWFNALTGPELFERVEGLLPAHRERLFPPTEALSMFVAQALSEDRSCQKAVNDAAVKRMSTGLRPCSTNTGAYCRARQRVPLHMVHELARYSGRMLASDTPKAWHWRGRPVRLVDGTTMLMPDTPENQAAYPQSRRQKPGLGFPLCRLVGLICLGSGALLEAAIGRCEGRGGDEHTLLRSIIDRLQAGEVLLGDAFYPSYFLLCALCKRGVDGLFEQNGTRRRYTDFRRGRRLGTRDHLIALQKPAKPGWMSAAEYQQMPQTLTVRELETDGKILVTTLLCPKQASKEQLKSLYRNRWHVELDLRNIKTTLGMEMLSCETPAMVHKEIWVYLLAYNLIRVAMAKAALLADRLPRQLSFKHTLQLCTAWTQQWQSIACDDTLPILCLLIAQQRVGERPRRVEPRAVKRRPKYYPLLTKPRDVARARIRRFGHPVK